MNSRERLIAAVSHRQPDRIPVDLGATSFTGISAIAYNKLVKHLRAGRQARTYDNDRRITGAIRPARVTDVVQQLADVDMEIIDLLDVDVVDMNRIFSGQADWYEAEVPGGNRAEVPGGNRSEVPGGNRSEVPGGNRSELPGRNRSEVTGMSIAEFPGWFRPVKMPDGSWQVVDDNDTVIYRMPAGNAAFDRVYFPFEDGYPEDSGSFREALKKLTPTVHTNANQLNKAGLRERAVSLRNNTGKAIVIGSGISLLETGKSARRAENFLTDLLVNGKKVSEMLDLMMDMNMETLGQVVGSLGSVADVICFGDDLGIKTGPLIDHETFRKFFRPRYKILCDYVRKHSDMKIFFHSCGSIREFIPDLIDIGIDILNPVQTDSRDMDPAVLKREYGRDIAFWGGGLDTPLLLNTGTPEEVRDKVSRRCEILSKDGGFVFAPIHSIMPEAVPQNIIAAYRAAKEFSSTIF